jgi:hypothetical protein
MSESDSVQGRSGMSGMQSRSLGNMRRLDMMIFDWKFFFCSDWSILSRACEYGGAYIRCMSTAKVSCA